MANELDFMDRLQHAMESADRIFALTQVLTQIGHGNQDSDSIGAQNGRLFVNELCRQIGQLQRHEQLANLLDQVMIKGHDLEQVTGSDPESIAFARDFNAFAKMAQRSNRPKIRVLKNNRFFGDLNPYDPTRLVQVVPGEYTFRLNFGWLLWEGRFEAADLILDPRALGDSLTVAADSEGQKAQPTRQIPLLAGMLTLKLFAGLEHGIIELARKENHAE